MSGPGLPQDKLQEFTTSLMARLQEFYFNEEAENCGQKIFFQYAAKHHQHFSEEEDATKIEQTLESTAIYEEFCGLFE